MKIARRNFCFCFFFSRDKTDLNELITDERLNLIIKNAGLDNLSDIKSAASYTSGNNFFLILFYSVTWKAYKLKCSAYAL